MPRKSKLTKKFISEFADLIEAGNFACWACKYMNVSDTIFYRWLDEGAKEKKAGLSTMKVAFVDAIEKAKANAQIENVKLITEGAKKNPYWASWWLERTDPKNWNKINKIDSKIDANLKGEVKIYLPDNKRKSDGD